MRYQGRITEWNDDKGYGFITPNGGGERVFVHIKAFTSRSRRPVGNELVKFVRETDARGRPRAEDVAFVLLGKQHTPGKRVNVFVLLIAAVFLAAAAVAGKTSPIVLYLYLGMSVLTFGAYAADKSAAKGNRWRTPENTLQLFALLGGWPGAVFAQQILRHKNQKLEFQIAFWIMVAINIGGAIFLLSTIGTHFDFGRLFRS